MTIRKFLIIAVSTLSMFITASVSTPTYAAKIKSKEAKAAAWTDCLIESDNKTALKNNRVVCCSKEAGFCIVCPNTGGGACDILDYMTRPELAFRDKAIGPGKSKLSPPTNGAPSKSPASRKVPSKKLSQ